MLRRLFGLGGSSNRAITDATYERIVAAARQPRFYLQWKVPDTPLGRYEMLSLHLVLALERMSGDPRLRDLAQEVTDEFFRDVDHSLRELGIGDMGVPKRMKKLARMFYGRAQSYSDALRASDGAALAAALARNVMPGVSDWPESGELAEYAIAMNGHLANQDTSELARGAIVFAAQGDARVR